MTLRCAWCSRVRAGVGWIPERRGSHRACTDGICERCMGIYFAQYAEALKGGPARSRGGLKRRSGPVVAGRPPMRP